MAMDARAGSVLLLPRRLRGAHLPPLPARPDVPPLPRRTGGVGSDCLVRSTDFTYSDEKDPADARNPDLHLPALGHPDRLQRRSTRRLSEAQPAARRVRVHASPIVQDTVEEVDPASLENLPVGLDGGSTSGPTCTAKASPASSPSRPAPGSTSATSARSACVTTVPTSRGPLRPVELVATKPNLCPGRRRAAVHGPGRRRPARSGRCWTARCPASTSTTTPKAGKPFRPFTARLNRDTRDPNLKFVDLDGDGHADVLITEDDAFVWHRLAGGRGLRPAGRVAQALDEEKRPPPRLRRRHAVHLPRRPVRRRPDRPRAHPQRRGLLLAQPGLWPLRRQGRRWTTRPRFDTPGPVRPATHPPGRHRRLRHDRHHLPAPRRRAPLLQPVGQQLERSRSV